MGRCIPQRRVRINILQLKGI